MLNALKEATHLGVEIHLKILQTLPSLMQNYGDYLSNDLIVELLLICYILQGGNKVPVVINTALATLQQLIISVFDKVAKEDASGSSIPKTFEVPIENNDKILVSPTSYDALRVFFDICNLIENQKPIFLKFGHLPETVSLELIESILTSHSEIFSTHLEFRYVIRTRAVPLLLRAFSEKRDYPVTVRVTRILYLIIRRLLPVLDAECEVILSLLIHMLDAEAAPYWKRVLCMEVFQGISLEYSLIQSIFDTFDAHEGKRSIIKDWITALEKLSSEQPSVIGLSNTSTPLNISDYIANSNGSSDSQSNPVDSFGNPIDLTQIPGLSSKTSLVRSSCIDLLDKTEPPTLPPSYLYYLTLTCVNSFAEGTARHILVNSLSDSSKKKIQAGSTDSKDPSTSPQKSKERGSSENTPAIGAILESIWPELLASFNTFFRATMDSDLYHVLVRSAQKFTHAAGVLLISEPRNAFLSLLGKFTITLPLSEDSKNDQGSGYKTSLLTMEGLVGTLSPTTGRDHSRVPSISGPSSASGSNSRTSKGGYNIPSRNILCFRALLNLAIVLGPTLGSGWAVVLETLQYADLLVYGSGNGRSRGNSKAQNEYNIETNPLPFSGLGSDFNTVENSVRRLIDSTKDYSSKPFNDLISSIGFLSSVVLNLPLDEPSFSAINSIVGIGNAYECDHFFMLELLGSVCYKNKHRFLSTDSQERETWKSISRILIRVETSRSVASQVRVRACQVFNEIIRLTSLQLLSKEKSSDLISSQKIVFESILDQVQSVIALGLPSDESISNFSTETKLHVTSLDYLNKLLDNCGGLIDEAWDIAFDIIQTVFTWCENESPDSLETFNKRIISERSIDLLKSGFESLQLICNDFLQSLPPSCIIRLIDTLYSFCHQEGDLNISFTSLSFFWTISDYLRQLLGDNKSKDLSQEVTSVDMLIKLSKESVGDSDSINSLWIIGLLKLATISYDPRPQVRNGAIQILFRIFEANGNQLPSKVWHACQIIVLEKVMDNDPFKSNQKLTSEEVTQWEETISLTFSSFGTILSSFLPILVKEPTFDTLWKRVLSYFQQLIDSKNLIIADSAYKSYNTILSGFLRNDQIQIQSTSLDIAWDFWANQKIVVDKAHAKSAQDAYTSLADAFTNLQALTPDADFSNTRINQTVELFNACASYPVLAPFYKDNNHLSPLQEKAFDQIKSIDIAKNFYAASLIILLYSKLIMLAFQLDKAGDDKAKSDRNATYKSPTFIYLSKSCLEVLEGKMRQAKPFIKGLIDDGTISKLTSSLLKVITYKSGPPYIISTKTSDSLKEPQLWQLADLRLLEIVDLSLPHITNKAFENQSCIAELWKKFSECAIAVISPGQGSDFSDEANTSLSGDLSLSIRSDFNVHGDVEKSNQDKKYEQFDIEIHRSLIKSFFSEKVFKSHPWNPPLLFWKSYLTSIFHYSLLYIEPRFDMDIQKFPPFSSCKTDDENAEASLQSLLVTVNTHIKGIIQNTFFGSTEGHAFKKRKNIAFECFSDLAVVCSGLKGEDSSVVFAPTIIRLLAVSLMTLRLAMALYLYISDHPLRGPAPMPKIQRKELTYLLTTVIDIPSSLDKHTSLSEEFEKLQINDKVTNESRTEYAPALLYPLLVNAIPIANNDTEILNLLQKIMLQINKFS